MIVVAECGFGTLISNVIHGQNKFPLTLVHQRDLLDLLLKGAIRVVKGSERSKWNHIPN